MRGLSDRSRGVEMVDPGGGGRNIHLGFGREGNGAGGKQKERRLKNRADGFGGYGSEVVWKDGRRRLDKVWTSLQSFSVYTKSC